LRNRVFITWTTPAVRTNIVIVFNALTTKIAQQELGDFALQLAFVCSATVKML